MINPGIIGAVAGSVIGTAGGVFGTYCSIKATKSPRERAFVVKCSIGMWIGVLAVVASLLFLQSPYKWMLFLPHVVILTLAIFWINRNQLQIREQEHNLASRNPSDSTGNI